MHQSISGLLVLVVHTNAFFFQRGTELVRSILLHFVVVWNFGVWIACMYTVGCFAIREDLS